MDYSISRRKMVSEQLKPRGITDEKVLKVMSELPRHLFVDEAFHAKAYNDTSLPIGYKQTISQPYMVAFMTQSLCLTGSETVLEIGTGSGYQAAVLGKINRRVYSIERIEDLAKRARKTLDDVGCMHVNTRCGDGTTGWLEQGPFDRIIITAGAPKVPQAFLDQLAVGGWLIIPVGDADEQSLLKIVRMNETDYSETKLLGCRFVPLIGKNGWDKDTRGRG